MTEQTYLQRLAASGKVPGLTRPCPGFNSYVGGWLPCPVVGYTAKATEKDKRRPITERGEVDPCGGSGQVPVSEAEVVLALWDFARSEGCQVLRGEKTTILVSIPFRVPMYLLPREHRLPIADIVAESDGTDAESLAHALCDALGLVKP